MKRHIVASIIFHGALGAVLIVSFTGEHDGHDRAREKVEFSVDNRVVSKKAFKRSVDQPVAKPMAYDAKKRAGGTELKRPDEIPPEAAPGQVGTGGTAISAETAGAGMAVAVSAPQAGGGGGVGASAGPGAGNSAGAGGVSYDEQYRAIRDSIEREAKNSYPLKARRLRIQGVVTARFSVGQGGLPVGIDIVRGSGHESLDRAATGIIERAAPYPAVPETVTIPIRFELER